MMLILSVILSLFVLQTCAWIPPASVVGKRAYSYCSWSTCRSASTNNNDEHDKAATASVLCIGDALFDCISDIPGLSLQDMVDQDAWTAFPGGANANVATALCKLGTRSAFCGCLGADTDGDLLQSLLHDTGVDVTLLQRHPSAPTRRVMVTRSMDGDREFGGFSNGRAADAFADCCLDASKDDENDMMESEIVTGGASWIVCGTLSLAFDQAASSVRQLVERGLHHGARLYVDINWRPVFWDRDTARDEIYQFAQQANILKMTDEEAEWLVGVAATEALQGPKQIHEEFFPKAEALLITAGEKGASYSMRNGATGRVEPFQVQVKETTGAGDAFTAGFLHSVISTLENELPKDRDTCNDIVRFAAAVGALTCTSEGAIAAQPTLAEVEAFLTKNQ